MGKTRRAAPLGVALAWLLAAGGAGAQTWTVLEDHEWCDRHSGADWCEVREITLADRDLVEVTGGKNGGIRVEGWDKDEVVVLAKVQVWDLDESDAEEFAKGVEIETDDRIRARGPSRSHGGNWGVSFRLLVPRETNLDLDAHNGGISIAGVSGDIEFSTRNGGVRLDDLGGHVYGRTRNGGVDIRLAGEEWEGDGLDVETRNGGVKLSVPEKYSARLVMSTVNGGISSDLPLEIQGRREKHLRATLGDGGSLLRISTTNGGVRIRET